MSWEGEILVLVQLGALFPLESSEGLGSGYE
ncbi:hypothetical protein EDC17_100910 [Sphingobacterium alimentarium]|uniref:Uncharacterized protein n=1 Tax=Sphingobacterium alimentarium TaxID=797292 RepID=A0A4R3VUS5_9SPHI|nr:hypothetical protein EDC17_100910 [Sphingobacterium alimentarium]